VDCSPLDLKYFNREKVLNFNDYIWNAFFHSKYTMISRFSHRLKLSSNLTFNTKSVKYNTSDYASWFTKYNHHPILELYHSPARSEVKDPVDNIFQNGFNISGRGNKGPGVYFASHSRYCACWGGTLAPAIICHVAGVDGSVKRFRSEMYSPEWSYEYTVGDPSLIFPICAVWYEINGSNKDFRSWRTSYTPHGSTGCIKCDSTLVFGDDKGIRCDCPLLPVCHPDDLVHNNPN
jgi:hypothetical protein